MLLKISLFLLLGAVLPTCEAITTNGCVKVKGCLRYPENCELPGCSYLATYVRQENSFLFELVGKNADWVSIGFNNEQKMIGARAVVCYNSTNGVRLGSKHLTNYNLQGIQEEQSLNLLNGSVENDQLTCRFSYPLDVTGSNNLQDLLAKNLYVLYAKGAISGENFSYHGGELENRGHTTKAINISEVSTQVEKETPDQCGKTIGCLRHPAGCDLSQCVYSMTYKKVDDRVEFKLRGQQSDWVSIGFNNDQRMVGTDAIFCVKSGSNIVVKRTVFTEKSLGNLTQESQLKYIDGSLENGAITCKFQRPIESNTIINLENSKYYLIYAKGGLTGTKPKWHGRGTANRGFSAEKVDIKEFVESVSSSPSDLNKRVHGSLMVIVWICLASVGVFFARYTRDSWGNAKIFDKKVWFQLHRTFMILVVLGTVTSFIVIFVDVGGFTESKDKFRTHAIMGIVVFVLAILQAIGALFRPTPDAPKRPIFNFLHRTFGVSAFVLSVATAILGLDIFDKEVGFYLVIGYAGFFLVVLVIMEVVKRRYEKKKMEHAEPLPGGMKMENTNIGVDESFFEISKLFLAIILILSLLVVGIVTYYINEDA